MDYELKLTPGSHSRSYWHDFFLSHELLYYLTWRDIVVRYKQTVVGILWAVLRPFLTMLVFTVVFSFLVRVSGPDGVPYSLLVLSGLTPWLFFATALSAISVSLIANSSIITKIYFPRIIIPLASLLANLVDFVVSLLLLLGLLLWYSYVPPWYIVALVPLTMLLILFVFGLGTWFAALTVRYRDFMQLVPFFLLLGMYISPVAYPIDLVPEKWMVLYSCNPMVGIIQGFRWAILGNIPFPQLQLAISGAATLLILYIGLTYFRATEQTFADSI